MSMPMSLGSELTKNVTPVSEDILVTHALAVITAHDVFVNDAGEPVLSYKQLIQCDPVLAERADTMAVTLLRTFGRYAKGELVKLLGALRNIPDADQMEYAKSVIEPVFKDVLLAAHKMAETK